jgi:hypothetical protein
MAVETVPVAGAKYTHFELGKDVVTGIAGFYTPYKEVQFGFRGRQLLYVVGRAVLEASCCGTGNWLYATVPGYILGWHTSENDGQPVSEVQPVTDRGEREEVARTIENAESVEVVTFW